ncbi:MAG: AraC family transcriptional regulator ligand-binding domain-containing protein [Burkholderiales bacterium]|nr:AraC family transcriptional regulator ligand-binding domain-containing protein [Burkholderiales bacterium]
MTTPPFDEPPVPFITVTNWVRAATLCGVDIGRIFREEGVDASKLHPETALIPRETMQHIMQRCVDDTRASGSPLHFPIVLGETFAFEYLSDIETFITTSPSLRDAARALEWLPALINPYMRLTLTEHGAEARLSLTFEHADATPANTWHFTEGTFVTFVKFTRLLLGARELFGRITFRHSPHSDRAACEAFFQMPLSYDESVNALWFDRALLDQPLRGAFPLLHEQAAHRVAERVAQRVEQRHERTLHDAATPLVAQIERTLAGKPHLLGQGLQALADELHLHPRTLQRRLREHAESHSAILGRVRHDLARQWLQDANLSIEDISERLGFSDRRSFTQAFTRWSGVTPSDYRRR